MHYIITYLLYLLQVVGCLRLFVYQADFTIKLITNKDEKGETFYFELNGVPVFMKGANYIPQHSMQDKVTDAHYEKILNETKNANNGAAAPNPAKLMPA